MIFTVGTVHSTDPATHRLRVVFDDQGEDMVSGWLPFNAGAGSYGLPQVGRQVWCLLRDEGIEDGLVICETYNDDDPPPDSGIGMFYWWFPNGDKIIYEDGVLTLKAASIILDGAVTVTGNLSAAKLSSTSIVEDAAGNVRT